MYIHILMITYMYVMVCKYLCMCACMFVYLCICKHMHMLVCTGPYGGWPSYMDAMQKFQQDNSDYTIFNISYEEMTLVS